MRGVKRVVVVLAMLLVVLVILAFVLENQQGVIISFMGIASAQMPVSVFVVLAFIVGMLISPFLGTLTRYRRRNLIR